MGRDLIPHSLAIRFELLNNGEMDLNTNHVAVEMDRDVHIQTIDTGISLSTPTFYMPSVFGGYSRQVACARGEIQDKEECSDLSVCTHNGTKHWDILTLTLPKNELFLVNFVDAFDAFVEGKCNVLVAPDGEMHKLKNILIDLGKPVDDFVVSPVLTVDGATMATREDDRQWSDFVFWALQALQTAEEHCVTQESVINGSAALRQTDAFGEDYKDVFNDTVAAVGNFGEIMVKHDENAFPIRSCRLSSSLIHLESLAPKVPDLFRVEQSRLFRRKESCFVLFGRSVLDLRKTLSTQPVGMEWMLTVAGLSMLPCLVLGKRTLG